MTANEIKDIRLWLGLTQHQLADFVGCQPRTISLWENGKHKPHPIFIKAIKLTLNKLAVKKRDIGDLPNPFEKIFKERF